MYMTSTTSAEPNIKVERSCLSTARPHAPGATPCHALHLQQGRTGLLEGVPHEFTSPHLTAAPCLLGRGDLRTGLTPADQRPSRVPGSSTSLIASVLAMKSADSITRLMITGCTNSVTPRSPSRPECSRGSSDYGILPVKIGMAVPRCLDTASPSRRSCNCPL